MSYHQAIDPRFVQKFDGTAPVGGDSPFHQPLTVSSSLYYEPHSAELEGQYNLGDFKVAVGLAYQLWKEFRPPILIAETVDSNGQTHRTLLPRTSFRNTFNPRVAVEVPLAERKYFVSAGYQFRPSPVDENEGNALIQTPMFLV